MLRWKDDIEGLVLSGGEGIPGIWGVVMASIGVVEPENGSFGSATDGDCNGDCIETCLVFADASIIKGGRSGVVAKASSVSSVARFAFSISMGRAEMSSRLPNILLVGVGGI